MQRRYDECKARPELSVRIYAVGEEEEGRNIRPFSVRDVIRVFLFRWCTYIEKSERMLRTSVSESVSRVILKLSVDINYTTSPI